MENFTLFSIVKGVCLSFVRVDHVPTQLLVL